MVTGLELRNLAVTYGDLTAVDEVSLRVPTGTTLALVGASGSGKSSLLRAVAGLEPLAGGQVLWDGHDLTGVKVHKRNFGLVFQDAQLFPTYDVAGNIGYGLKSLRGKQKRQRITEMLELVGLAGYENRKVSELSGGQAQRVALARSLAPKPRALLLDEPFSALDRGLREHLAEQTAQILRTVGTTAIHITHDQQEAFTLGDQVAVLDHGRLLQVAEPEELWHNPSSREVATFLGCSAFIDLEEARLLGFDGEVPHGYHVGVGPHSLVVDPAGTPIPVIREGLAPNYVEVHVTLPGGQRATVAAQQRIDAATVPVRLASGPLVPDPR